MEQISSGKGQEAVEDLIFFTPPSGFIACLETLLPEMTANFRPSDEVLQARYLRFLAELTLGLRSFLPRWNLQNADRNGEAALTDAQIEVEAEKAMTMVTTLAAAAPAVAEELLSGWRAETVARLKAEQAADPSGEGAALVGNSLSDYVANLSKEFSSSHLRRISEMRAAGQTLTELSNDYAAFLEYTLYLGASFVTCNPPLVDLAWVADPERWNPVVDDIITHNPGADADELARLVTMEVVLANMRLLRPIFLLTEGQMGCVCLQVNPHKHADAATMVSDALLTYEKMRDRLDGEVPNVVFKLPGTKAGLEACRALTEQGIGSTITVNFGMFQHLPFAQAIHEGHAIFGCLVEMNGRLAYPVRDELLAKLDELEAYGINEAAAREAAAWAGVAVIKRLYNLLGERDYNLGRVKLLIASLRIYEGDGYAHLPSAFPDITEVMGASIISVFPNIRRAFDTQMEVRLDPLRIETSIADGILEVLRHSEIFKQAYYVGDQDWVPHEDSRFRPKNELTLADEAGTAAWTPVQNTLTEFCVSYDKFVGRILERKQNAA
jgi:transaldolase